MKTAWPLLPADKPFIAATLSQGGGSGGQRSSGEAKVLDADWKATLAALGDDLEMPEDALHAAAAQAAGAGEGDSAGPSSSTVPLAPLAPLEGPARKQALRGVSPASQFPSLEAEALVGEEEEVIGEEEQEQRRAQEWMAQRRGQIAARQGAAAQQRATRATYSQRRSGGACGAQPRPASGAPGGGDDMDSQLLEALGNAPGGGPGGAAPGRAPGGAHGAPPYVGRCSSIMDVARLLAEAVQHNLRCLAFCKTRKLSELILGYAREILQETDPSLVNLVCGYRAGYAAEERREIERDLFSGRFRGVAATNALELGIDVGSLDVTIHLGFPGTVASLWQQAGRAGRREQKALSIYVAFDSPLDQYFMKDPKRLFDRPLEVRIRNRQDRVQPRD